MSDHRPLVSVVTANHNGASHLAAAIRSVLEQTLGAVEMILIDDASNDDSLAVAREAAGNDERLRIISMATNGGPGAARNRGFAEARGEWIAVFDSDDLMAPDRLTRLIDRGTRDQADIVADNLMAFENGTPPETGRPFLAAASEPRWIGLADLISSSRMYAKAPGLGYLKPILRAEAWRSSGVRYDETLRIGEDYAFLQRLLAKGLRLRLEPDPLYFYRRHSASISHTLRRDHLEAMLRADASFECEFPELPAQARSAQAARRRSLERALTYDDVIQSLKRRDLARGVTKAISAPDVWPLLAMPVQARMKRLADRLGLQPA